VNGGPPHVPESLPLSNILITVNGDTATSETYGDVTLRQVVDDGTYVDMRNLGLYIDRWERGNNEWRIISRIYLHDFDETNPSGGAFTTTGRRDRNDPSYFDGEKDLEVH
jgi:SnoaL-like domain